MERISNFPPNRGQLYPPDYLILVDALDKRSSYQIRIFDRHADNCSPIVVDSTDFDTLNRQIATVRRKWKDFLAVPLGVQKYTVSEIVDLRNYEEEIRKFADDLRGCGQNLLQFLFSSSKETASVQRFLDYLSRHSARLKIYSSPNFTPIPWSLLCSPREKGDSIWSGLWGVEHVIDLKRHPEPFDMRIPAPKPGAEMRMYVDSQLHHKLTHVDHVKRLRNLEHYLVHSIGGRTQLVDSLDNDRRIGRIAYFLCHGRLSEDGYTKTSDFIIEFEDGTISSDEVATKLRRNGQLCDTPFVFLNTCDAVAIGVDPSCMHSFVTCLIEGGAIGAIGPTIEMPILFGMKFAEEFFLSFSNHLSIDGPQTFDAAMALRAAANELVRQVGNPLGAAYCCYQSGACYLDRGASE